jgi:predicted Rossmann fold flavoprotein
MTKKIAVIGGGAAGFFAALSCAEEFKKGAVDAEITIFEGNRAFLRKVKISGGGRCNVTHNEFNTSIFCEAYPRGKKELRSPMETFQAFNTVEWFSERGVKLVAEEDGRMFPSTNDSQTIIDCFTKECDRLGVIRRSGVRIKDLKYIDGDFILKDRGERYLADALLIATGSDKSGYELIESLGHQITDLAPSLFTFKINDPLFKEMAGTSFKEIEVKTCDFGKRNNKTRGPILITHHGLSGPAILELSARAAREMKEHHYRTGLTINWTPFVKEAQVKDHLLTLKKDGANALIKNRWPEFLTKKFWGRILEVLEVSEDKKYNELGMKDLNKIVLCLFCYKLNMTGQNRFKEEFVECGGVNLKEVSFQTMESKIISKLFFAGEVLDVDGITGGYNFQNAWTTGHLAGQNLAFSCLE